MEVDAHGLAVPAQEGEEVERVGAEGRGQWVPQRDVHDSLHPLPPEQAARLQEGPALGEEAVLCSVCGF